MLIQTTAQSKSKTSFNQQAADYDQAATGAHARALYPHVLAALAREPYQCVLDVGCGTGAILASLPPQPDLRLAGLDLSPAMLAVARQKLGQQADLQEGDASTLPWSAATFDVVLCVDSFHHYPQPAAVIAEIARVLRPGGRVIVADLWLPTPIRQGANLVLPFTKGGDVRIYSQVQLRTLWTQAEWHVSTWRFVTNTAYLMVART
jgi:ubiquinone/menaquinone biosynthesis C-methylase UbiE